MKSFAAKLFGKVKLKCSIFTGIQKPSALTHGATAKAQTTGASGL